MTKAANRSSSTLSIFFSLLITCLFTIINNDVFASSNGGDNDNNDDETPPPPDTDVKSSSMTGGSSKTGDFLERETGPLVTDPNSPLNLTQTDDERDIDVSVNLDDIEDEVIENRDMKIISTKGANDIDVDGFPPPGMTLMITNETVIATFDPVHIDLSKQMEPSIIDEISKVANEMSNGTIIVDVPPQLPATQLVSSGVEPEDEGDNEEQSDDEEDQDTGNDNTDEND